MTQRTIFCFMAIICLRITFSSAENPPDINRQTGETKLLESLKLNLYSNPSAKVGEEEVESVKLEAAVGKDQFIIKADLQESEKYQVSNINADAIDANAPVDEDFDMELAEINVFRPVFQYRLAYAKQVKNSQRRQYG